MLECKDLTASMADVASAAGEWAATAAAKAWDVTSLASASAATLAASVARRMEQVDWKLDRQYMRTHQRHILLSGMSMAVSLSAIYYLSSVKRQRRLLGSAAPKSGDDGAPPPSPLTSVAESPTESHVLGCEIEFNPEQVEQESILEVLRTPVKQSREEDAGTSSAPTTTTTDSPDTSFETATSMDGSIFDDATVATTDPGSAKVRVKELIRLAKSLARKKKFAEAADSYTEALDILETIEASDKISALIVTLLNSRSLMYEQAGLVELAIEDCQRVLAKSKGASPVRVQKRMARLQQLVSAAGASTTPSPKKRSPLRLSFLKKVGFSPNRASRTPKATTPS